MLPTQEPGQECGDGGGQARPADEIAPEGVFADRFAFVPAALFLAVLLMLIANHATRSRIAHVRKQPYDPEGTSR